MEYTLRRTSRKRENDEAWGILRRCTWGFLSIVGPNATPYGVPLNYALLEQDDEKHLIFHCANEGRKTDYLKLNPQAAFVAVEDAETLPEKFSTAYASAMVSGNIEIIEDPKAKRALLRFLVHKLAPAFQERGDRHIEHRLSDCCVLKLKIEHICGKGRKKEEPYALADLGF
jgi:nitroimidazol reductase NimA-like FMN-containing flavoprotein (pyridoxamine 5'-phosphate oxidase superfamily)